MNHVSECLHKCSKATVCVFTCEDTHTHMYVSVCLLECVNVPAYPSVCHLVSSLTVGK